MPQVSPIRVRAPLGGVRLRADYQNSEIGSLYTSRDFWPLDANTGRDRLAVRPGWSGIPSSQNNVNLIQSINVAPSETTKRVLVTATGGTLYTWPSGTPTSVGSGIDTSRNVQSTVYLDTLYIANNTPKKLVYGGAVATWTASDGTVPVNARLICTWADRIVMAGVTTAPHIWYMSRVGDPNDWLYAADDNGSPVAATDIDDGRISSPITALIPHNRECILFGTADNLIVLRGNPADGGNLETISHVVGPINGTAWCKTSDGWTYFLGRDGFYRMPPGCGSAPESISREKIPNSLIGLDGINDVAYMAYDVRYRCIHIYIEGSNAQRWHYFPEHQGFFPVTAPGATILAIGCFNTSESADFSAVLIGTASGIKLLDRSQPLSGASFAFATFSPIRLAEGLGEKAVIQRAVVAFGDNSDDSNATIAFYGGADGESAIGLPTSRKALFKLSSCASGHSVHPRIGGQAAVIKVAQSDTSKHVSFEEATLYVIPRGKVRN